MLSGPHQIIDGRFVPISAAQWGRDAQGRLLPTASARRSAAPPPATASAPPSAAAPSAEETRAKAKAFDDAMAAEARARSRASMLKTAGLSAEGTKPTAAQREADRLAALPKTIAEAGGDVRAFGRADIQRQAAAASGVAASNPGRASMEKLVRGMGMVPKG